MTFESFSTVSLTLTGPTSALLLSAMLLRLRPLRGAQNLWVAVWLIALSVRFGKSTLHALVGLDGWILNLGLAGMVAAPPALLLAIRASAGTPWSMRQLLHFTPVAILASGASWIPNVRGNLMSALIYTGILVLWVGYTILGWRELVTTNSPTQPYRRLMTALATATTVTGLMFIAVFAGMPQLYLLNCAMFSFAVLSLGALLVTEIATRSHSRTPGRTPSAEQSALTKRARAALADPRVLADTSLSLARMARKLGVPQKTLSTAINVVTGESFTTLLNAERVAAAQRELSATTDSIELIAARCGFSSASAFHRTFRRHVQSAPAAWRKAIARSHPTVA